MAAKAILLFCAQALFIQSVFSQCINRAAIDAIGINSWAAPGLAAPWGYNRLAAPLAYDGLAYPAGCAGRGLAYDGLYAPAMEFTATSGGALPVTSASAIRPTGISIVSENVYEGALIVTGELPFVGTTAMEGVLPTAGAGAINHGCGNGLNAMSAFSETSTPASVATAAPAFAAPGLVYDGLMAPALAALAFGAPGLATSVLAAPSLAYDGLIAPGLTTSVLAAPSFAYDGLAGPGLAASVLSAPALGYNGLVAPGLAAPAFAYDGLGYTDAAWAGRGLFYDGLTYASPIEALEITPTSGGALPVSSASAMPPTGITVASENAFEGALAVAGELPFVGTVAVEGAVPAAGAGAVNHACGNGRNAMISESTAFAPAATAYAPAAAIAPTAFGYRGGCGCAF